MSTESGQGRDIIVVGASAGGVEALSKFVHGLPADLPAAVFVVLHVPAHGTSLLPQILNRNGQIPARHAVDGEEIRRGQIYVAPPDFHLLIEGDRVRLSRGPRENGHRPAVDPLFRSAARFHGRRVIGVILSGTLDDGSAGLSTVQRSGGMAVVQDPADALYPGMPRSALEALTVDHCLPISEIPELMVRLADDPVPDLVSAQAGVTIPEEERDRLRLESEVAAFDMEAVESAEHPGVPSGFGCPDCGGALWEIHEGELIRFRCRVGHAWTVNSLLAEQSHGVEAALWTALRALEERAVLCARIAERLGHRGNVHSAARFLEQSQDARQRAAILRQVLIAEPATIAEVGSDGNGSAEAEN